MVCDRYIDSSLAYQGAGRDLDLEQLEATSRWATGGLHRRKVPSPHSKKKPPQERT